LNKSGKNSLVWINCCNSQLWGKGIISNRISESFGEKRIF